MNPALHLHAANTIGDMRGSPGAAEPHYGLNHLTKNNESGPGAD
jgi:hypothetical protein